ncbi:glycosyltransferase family 2 protein [Clostridium tarantellae]|uniref:Glycosyltransferase n=1 Tax=Clostridium tarantellae TaxID=39493 RepID=A0A6I1MFL6_9CLOT|nr:glycosyltransferase family A protein [Clostridium tarantellae]MPQ42296.1 glycosyltransferase [Clostridium tarantellae]
MKTLTIFTPTYNRAYTLHKCYESLKKQSCKDFIWLIIDDGSSDNTKELVQIWIEDNEIEIKYFYQKNQGMHGAHNTAYELIQTELNTCIDSDDYMPDDAVEKILSFWKNTKSSNIAGIVALDAYKNGNIIGDNFPENLKRTTLFDIYQKHKLTGDKKLIYRTELTKKYPYPNFEGEKYVSLGYKYAKIDLEYELATMNEVVCIVEYMEDGSSKNMLKQYRKNPKGFAFIRVDNLKNPKASFKFKFKECIHYVSSSLIAKNKNFLSETPCKLLTVLAMPMGILLYLYIMKNTSDLCKN